MTQKNQHTGPDKRVIPDALRVLHKCSQRVETVAYSLAGKGTAHELAELIRVAAIIETEVKALERALFNRPYDA